MLMLRVSGRSTATEYANVWYVCLTSGGPGVQRFLRLFSWNVGDVFHTSNFCKLSSGTVSDWLRREKRCATALTWDLRGEWRGRVFAWSAGRSCRFLLVYEAWSCWMLAIWRVANSSIACRWMAPSACPTNSNWYEILDASECCQ